MKDSIFDLEQEIMHCWNVVDDIDTVTKWFVDDPKWQGMDGELCDAVMNKYFAIKEIYDLKFDHLFKTFEKVCKEYHTYRKTVEEWDNEIELSYPNDMIEISTDNNLTVDIGDIDIGDIVVGPFGEQDVVPKED